jgi:TIR domain
MGPKQPDLLTPETIFVSYGREDWDILVEPLVIDLRQQGFKVWIDQHFVQGGDNWYMAIQEALDTCERMVWCVSPDSIKSSYVQREYRYFMEREKWILPLICREAALPWDVQGIQYVRYQERQKLLETLRGWPDNIDETYQSAASLQQRIQQQVTQSAQDFFGDSLGRLKGQLQNDHAQLESLAELSPPQAQAQLQEMIDSYHEIEKAIDQAVDKRRPWWRRWFE